MADPDLPHIAHPDRRARILCYVVAYNAAPFIQSVLERIPAECWDNAAYSFEVLISDDSSKDNTFDIASEYAQRSARAITVTRTVANLGYGGNQKLGYNHARKYGFDAVILLHGDGQYDPACIPSLLAPILNGSSDVVLGSRMMHRQSALKGGMPAYKFLANIALTKLQNVISGGKLSEFHTGYRVYSVPTLNAIAYEKNDNGFSFDTEILLQLLDAKKHITEIAIPTHYGDEVCHVNGVLYAWQIVIATICFKLHQLGFIYDPRLSHKPVNYPDKTTFTSSQQFALRHVGERNVVADLGGGCGYVARALRAKNCTVTGFDHACAEAHYYDRFIETDLSHMRSITAYGVNPDTILCLDLLEHLAEPGLLLQALREDIKADTQLIITVPNVAFITVRLQLLCGYFTYASRGIMDRTHLRFFTFATLCDLIHSSGYEITKIKGIPAPFPLVVRNAPLAFALLKLNSALIYPLRNLFSFQIAVIAKPRPYLPQ
jgi:glycosyltransferase involved in cell wall biosynthesis